MRSAPLSLATKAVATIEQSVSPDVVLCTDMLDVTCWLGLLSRINSPGANAILKAPLAFYLHENQWTYPESPSAKIDHHFAYTNLTSAIAADTCWFNSAFHQDDFLQACTDFIGRMPDSQDDHALGALRKKSSVLYPGFDLPAETNDRELNSNNPRNDESSEVDRPLKIGWVSRWEFDKRPDEFLRLLCLIDSRDVDFQLILLGERKGKSKTLAEILRRFEDRILVADYAETQTAYVKSLRHMDVVVSTADHEFFGIAICEAIASGAAPVLPDRLSYRELVPNNERFETIEQAAEMVQKFTERSQRMAAAKKAKDSIENFRAEQTVHVLDQAIANLAAGQISF